MKFSSFDRYPFASVTYTGPVSAEAGTIAVTEESDESQLRTDALSEDENVTDADPVCLPRLSPAMSTFVVVTGPETGSRLQMPGPGVSSSTVKSVASDEADPVSTVSEYVAPSPIADPSVNVAGTFTMISVSLHVSDPQASGKSVSPHATLPLESCAEKWIVPAVDPNPVPLMVTYCPVGPQASWSSHVSPGLTSEQSVSDEQRVPVTPHAVQPETTDAMTGEVPSDESTTVNDTLFDPWRSDTHDPSVPQSESDSQRAVEPEQRLVAQDSPDSV